MLLFIISVYASTTADFPQELRRDSALVARVEREFGELFERYRKKDAELAEMTRQLHERIARNKEAIEDMKTEQEIRRLQAEAARYNEHQRVTDAQLAAESDDERVEDEIRRLEAEAVGHNERKRLTDQQLAAESDDEKTGTAVGTRGMVASWVRDVDVSQGGNSV